jgi:hypothetical protein
MDDFKQIQTQRYQIFHPVTVVLVSGVSVYRAAMASNMRSPAATP